MRTEEAGYPSFAVLTFCHVNVEFNRVHIMNCGSVGKYTPQFDLPVGHILTLINSKLNSVIKLTN